MKLYKYYPPESFDFIFTNNGISARLTPPRALNDPLEIMPSFSDIEREIINHNYLDLPDDHIEIKKNEINKTLYTGITEKYEKTIGIFSLSKKEKSNPMWAYYEKDHTGYLIEFSSLKIGEGETTLYLIDGNIFRNVYYTNKT